ncbi:MAG: aspartate aminotransferase family protein [Alphaproteobacteria bacterium]|nr:aspartate aminotransferase family protein [Alphaproteobacteria bacterium]
MPTYARANLEFDRGEGCYLYTADNRRFLDFAAGIAVTSVGHSHPHVVDALKSQAEKLWHVSNLYTIPGQEKLAKRLCENSFADVVFFSNSGAEACEGAIKLARKYHSADGRPEKTRIITVKGAFHGRTTTTIAAAGNEKYTEGFGPLAPGFDTVAWGNLNELRGAITHETAAIMVEPVQGEGGIRPASLDYLRELRKIADEYGLLLIFDEVQIGFGRSGKLFGHEWAGIAPDVMAIAKGMGGGFPVGAFLATAEAAKGMTAGTHGSTYGGNPLAMAVGNAVLDVVLEPGFLERVDMVGRRFWKLLLDLVAKHPSVFEEVRGAGLMLGLKCVVPNGEMVGRLREEGLLTVPAAENVVRLLPPLTVEDRQIDEAMAILDRVAANWAASSAA